MTKPLPFPPDEFSGRMSRALEAFARDNVDAVLVQAERNWYRDHAVRYLTGYDCPCAPTYLLIAMDGDPVLLVPDHDEVERAAQRFGARDARHASDPAEAIADWLATRRIRRLGIAGGECMGFSALDVLPKRLGDTLQARFLDMQLVDVGAALLALRAVRTPREIDVLRQAAHLSDVGADAFLATMRAGVSERDLWSEVWYAMQRAGADDVHMSLCCGPRSFWPHPPSDAVFAPGDIVSVELSPRVDGYFSQSNRMCFVGADSRELRELSHLATEAREIAASAMRPGVPARDVVAKVSAYVGKTQLATMDVGGIHRIGHGCGLCVDEGPFLSSSSANPLQADMTMALHPIMYLPYRHSMLMLGDYVRITGSGVEIMTTPQTEIPAV
jgi:Xaa-Pro aminopeptidase